MATRVWLAPAVRAPLRNVSYHEIAAVMLQTIFGRGGVEDSGIKHEEGRGRERRARQKLTHKDSSQATELSVLSHGVPQGPVVYRIKIICEPGDFAGLSICL